MRNASWKKKWTENKSKQYNKQQKLLCHGMARHCNAVQRNERIWNNNATSCLKSLKLRQIVNYLHMHVPYINNKYFNRQPNVVKSKLNTVSEKNEGKKLEDKQKKVRKCKANNVYKRKVKARCHISCRNLSHFLVFMCVLHRQDLSTSANKFRPLCVRVYTLCVCAWLYLCAMAFFYAI